MFYYHGLKNYAQSSAKEVGILLNGKNRGEFNEEEDKFFIKSRTKYVNAIKELSTKNTALETRVATLEAA